MRRNNISMQTPSEKAIREAVIAVEGMGWADPLLTEAVAFLGQAQDKVAEVLLSGMREFFIRAFGPGLEMTKYSPETGVATFEEVQP